MKRILLKYLVFVFAIASANAQENESYSHWSLSLKGGGNYFRVEPSASTHPSVKRLHGVFGGSIDYSINQLAGIGLELLDNPYGGYVNLSKTLDGKIVDIIPYFSVNLSNLLSPNRDRLWKNVNIYSETGMGVGFFHYSLNNAPNTYNRTMLAKTSVNAEYNIGKLLAFALEGHYRYYGRDDLGGTPIRKGVCEALDFTLGLRFKWGACRKKHVRNFNMFEPEKPNTFEVTKTEDSFRQTSDSLELVEKANVELKQKLMELQVKLNILAACNNTPVKLKSPMASFQKIEFGFDSSVLTQASLPILNEIAEILREKTYWSSLKISGNADSTGPSDYNLSLSERRANTVKCYLIDKEVLASKMISIGNGEEKPIASNKTHEGRQKNRRVDFEILK